MLTLLLSTVAPTAVAEASATAAPDIEFNRHFLIGGASDALDLASFEAGHGLAPGVYSLNVHLNDQLAAQASVCIEADTQGSLHPCLSKSLLEQWGSNGNHPLVQGSVGGMARFTVTYY